MSDQPQAPPPSGPLMYRKATAELTAVSFAQRTIELVVIPYDTEALVDQPYGRPVLESVAPGAFAGIERRANRIRANRDHQEARTFGRALALHPNRSEGLVAELRVARTPLGDETLELADDGCLDASAAFRPMTGGSIWSRARDRVRLTKLYLFHIALVPEPAYETANVLAVRSAPEPGRPARPNLQTVREWRLSERYDSIT